MPAHRFDEDSHRTGARREEEPLGLDDFAEPADEGLSLEQLGQTYAALLQRGSDPYCDPDAAAAEASGGQSPPYASGGGQSPPYAAGGGQSPPRVPPDDEADLPADDRACDVSPRSILEAILFVGHPTGEPLTSERIAALMRGVRPAEIDELVEELNAEYDAEAAPYTIVSVGPGYMLALRPEFAPLRDAFYGRIREARLSQAALDVLAIVAYHQPVAQDVIDRLRGKPSGAILSQLVRRDLLLVERPDGGGSRSEPRPETAPRASRSEPRPEAAPRGAKPAYRTTSRFLDLFGLSDLSELPRSQDVEREL